ncbi:MAG: hypothetical protein MRJ92_02875 [Nitrospira sp.]|nr:hypothetical protein [Nitrospira sp.]
MDIALFSSYQREDGWREHSEYWISTVNLNVRYRIDDRQSLYVKAVNLDQDEKYAARLTPGQFQTNPRQMGGTPTTNPVSLNSKLRDRLTLIGAVYERQIDANTTLTTEADYQVRDINQPVGTSITPSFKHYTDLRHTSRLFDLPLRSWRAFCQLQRTRRRQQRKSQRRPGVVRPRDAAESVFRAQSRRTVPRAGSLPSGSWPSVGVRTVGHFRVRQ